MTVKGNKAGHEFNFMLEGKRYHRSFKGLSEKEVIAKEEEMKTDLRRNVYSPEKKKVIKLSEIISDHKLYQKVRYSRPNEFNYAIEKFFKLVGDRDIKSITLQDFEKYKAILVDGSPKIVYGNEGIKVWIYKAIKTNRYEFEIYTWDYGSEIESLLGKGFQIGFIKSETPYLLSFLFRNHSPMYIFHAGIY